ncbi:nitrile hydratase accessory protein, partial [Mycobacterium sp.]|uniref:nitrile hydratase accessory protein n=1 Tax=Mycobacterium sp. TaxID=1785 RepID=UPI003C76FF61
IVEQLDARGENAPPRINGELTFSAPWEATVFALAVAISNAGTLDSTEFHQQLIAEIQHRQDHADVADDWDYYQRWLTALEHVVCRRGLVTPSELRERTASLAAYDDHHG